MTTADGQLTPLAAEIAALASKSLTDLRIKTVDEAAVWIAVRTLAIPDIADGLRALPVLAALKERHQPRTWGDSDVRVCDACQTAWPCVTRRILDGTTEQQPAVTL